MLRPHGGPRQSGQGFRLGNGPFPAQAVVVGLMPYNREHEGLFEDMPDTPGHHHPHYVSALSLPPLGFGANYTGGLVQHLDDAVEKVRQSVIAASRAAFKGSGKTLLFMDYAEILAAHDHKHLRGKLFGPAPGRLRQGYGNRALGDLGRLAGRNLRGGICSLDNHHPSAMAYAHVAEVVRQSLPAAIPSTPIRVTDEDDPVLTDPPHWAIGFLQTLRPCAPDEAGAGEQLRRCLPGAGTAADVTPRAAGVSADPHPAARRRSRPGADSRAGSAPAPRTIRCRPRSGAAGR